MSFRSKMQLDVMLQGVAAPVSILLVDHMYDLALQAQSCFMLR